MVSNIHLDKYKKSGIYSFFNMKTNERYIGQSRNISIRVQTHLSRLRNNRHTYKDGTLSMLQKAWNKYGEESFVIQIIEYCDFEELNSKEKYWIEYFKCNHEKWRSGYNATDGGEMAFTNKNNKGKIQIYKDEIQKMIYPCDLDDYISSGWTRGIKPTTKEKMNQNRPSNSGSKHWAYGKTFSKSTKEKMSEGLKRYYLTHKSTNIGKKHTQEWKERMSEKFKGRVVSKETAEKVSAKLKKKVAQYDKDNNLIKIFESGMDAQNETGISRSHISQCCNMKRLTAGKYKWRFVSNEMD